MSLSKNTIVECTNCNAKQNFKMWQSVNVTENPELKKSIFTQELFTFDCEKCGAKIFLLYPFIYHDSNKKLFIYFDPDGNFENVIETAGYVTKTADNYLNLLELIKIFDDELEIEKVEKLKEKLFIKFSVNQDLKNIDMLYYCGKNGKKVSFLVPQIKTKIECDL